MAEMTMVGNWTGPHPSSLHQPPTSTGVRPAGAYRVAASSSAALRPSSPPPPPATGKRPAAPVVDIQICLALSGRPASLEGLSLEAEDVGGAGELTSLSVAAPGGSGPSWSGNGSVVPLARPRRGQLPGPAAAAAPHAARAAVVSPAPAAAASGSTAAGAAPVPAAQAAAASLGAAASPTRPTVSPAPQRRKVWLLGALAALVAVLAGALQLRVRSPIEAPGAVLAPASVVAVAAAGPGTLAQLLVQPGDAVVENQIVAQLATAPFEAELMLRWEAFVERQGELAAAEMEEGILRDQSAINVAEAAWGLVQAQSALAAASVRVPCRGRVENIDARPGELVTAGRALLQIAPAGVARSIVALVPAEEQPFVQPGADAAVLLQPEQPAARSSDARVTEVSDSTFGTDALRAVLPGAAAGTFLRVQLELQGAAPELLDQLRTGERVSVRLQGREQRALSVMLDSLRALRG